MPSWTPRLPISFQAGTVLAEPEVLPSIRLQVVDHPNEQGPALISQHTAQQLGIAAGSSSRAFLTLAGGSDCILPVAVAAEDGGGGVADGHIAVTAVQQYNLHLGSGITEEFSLFVPPAGEPFELVDLEAEVTLLGKSDEEVQVDARAVVKDFLRLYFGLVLALNEACVLQLGGRRLLLRVTATNTLDQEAQEEQVAYHCFRGLLTSETQIFLTTPAKLGGASGQAGSSGSGSSAAEQQQAVAGAAVAGGEAAGSGSSGGGSGNGSSVQEEAAAEQRLLPQSVAASRRSVVLLNARQRAAGGPSHSTVIVHTNDGEWFPVKRKLLRPCIALTKVVRSEEQESVNVDIDTLTFDRVLIFLEALALDREPPSFGLHLCNQLLAAAQHLGLRALEEHCQQRLGESHSRVRFYSFDEIKALNAAGGCWLILDGMVLDVTRWLPEHPGGSKIIPRQSLNLDCSRFFELYHASRESFVYLRQFYHGEVLPEDRGLVPAPAEPPSAEFMQQLREYTSWRLQLEESTHTHLGQKRR